MRIPDRLAPRFAGEWIASGSPARRLVAGALLFALALAAVWLPRRLALDRFVTPDEPAWLGRSASFYYALAHRQFADTFQHSHPGVTATWAGALAWRLDYPAIAQQASEKALKNWRNLEPFLRERGLQPLPLLVAARTWMVAGTTLALGLAFWMALRLFGPWPALAGFLLLAFDPFHAGLTRLLHLDGLASSGMLLSALAFLSFARRGRRGFDLALSAVAAGLSWLTKVPALFLAPFAGMVMAVEALEGWRSSGRLNLAALGRSAWPLAAWAAGGALVFAALWPAMWVDPLGTLLRVFGQAFAYAEEGHSSPVFFNGRVYEGDPGWAFYPLSYLWRATPPVLAGLVLALVAYAGRRWPFDDLERRRAAVYLALYAALFGLAMSAGAKKFDRYLLPAFPALDVLAGLGLAALAGGVKAAGRLRLAQAAGLLLAALAIGWQALLAAGSFPYYLSYYNPLMGGSARAPQVMMIGWGEGLDQAARYLNSLPQAEGLRAMAHYPDGSFSYFFEGETLALIDRWEGPQSEALEGVDYLVLYVHQWQRQRPDPALLAYFARQIPEYVARIDGLDYAQVYNLRQTRP